MSDKRMKKNRIKKPLFWSIVYFALGVGVIVMLMPFVWMILTSFKLSGEVESFPPRWTTDAFSSHRSVQLNLIRGEGFAIDFSSLRLEEFLNLDVLLASAQEEGEKLLSLSINDDPPYRGTMTLTLGSQDSVVTYTQDIPSEMRHRFDQNVDSFFPLPDDLMLPVMEILEIEDTTLMLIGLKNYLFFGQNSLVTRRLLTQWISQTMERSNQVLIDQGDRWISHARLQDDSGDSVEVAEEKQRIRAFFQESMDLFPTTMARLQLRLDDLRRGRQIFEANEITEFAVFFKELIRPLVDLPDTTTTWAALNLYHRNFAQPLLIVQNLLSLSMETWVFYEQAQDYRAEDFSIRFQFPSEETQKSAIIKQLERAPLTNHQITTTFDIIESVRLGEYSTRLLQIINQYWDERLDQIGIPRVRHPGVIAQLREITDPLHSLFAPFFREKGLLEDHTIDRLTDHSWTQLGDMARWNTDQSSLFAQAIVRTRLLLANDKISEGEIASLIIARISEDHWIRVFSDIYNRETARMEILSAPEQVRSIRYRGLRTIEVEFGGIDPFWFWDEPSRLTVSFTPGEIVANIFQNYVNAWNAGKYFGYYYFNTVFIAIVTTFLNIIFAAMAAFAFSKMRFFAKNAIFMIFISTMMVPGEVLLVPNYITLTRFGWIDTYWALIVPWTVSVFVIFLMRQHFLTVPDELYDAGKIDGITKWGFLWRVMVPLSKPVIITGALLQFVGSWNAFLWVLIVTKSPQVRTLPVGLANFSSEVGTMYNQLMAASTFSMLPVVILFLFVQKYFIQGIARTGLK